METRSHSFGEDHKLTFVDRFGIWLSNRRILKLVKVVEVRSVTDIGSGFYANLSRSLRTLVSRSVIVDVALSNEMISSTEFDTYVRYLMYWEKFLRDR
jgi:hypothetical protein